MAGVLNSSNRLVKCFVRPCPQAFVYQERLKKELELIKHFGFEKVFLQVADILEMAHDIPYIIRGSAASSLVCYLMGFTQIDPVKERVSLARFMNLCREDFPDIDIDFPYNKREILLDRVRAKYGDRIARISNHIHYKRASALREAVRRHGHRKFLPKGFDVEQIFPDTADQVRKTADELMGTFKGHSLHCGGIVIFDKAVTPELLLKKGQIRYDKNDIKKKGLIKIDLLCNRGLAQLFDVSKRPLEDYPGDDKKTAALFCRGDVLGITFSESPAMKRLVQAIQPRSRQDIALCLALVRPAAASRGRKLSFLKNWQRTRKQTQIVYDDDATKLIQHLTGLSEDRADYYRRAFAHNNEPIMRRFENEVSHVPNYKQHMESLGMMREYSFCKSHAISYSYLVWALAYCKIRNPKAFWHAALMHCHSMYAPWVHIAEAKKAGLKFVTPGPNWKRDGDTLYDPSKTPFLFCDGRSDYKKHGYWLSPRFMPGCTFIRQNNRIRIRGLVATYRRHIGEKEAITFVTVGTKGGHYWDLTLHGNYNMHGCDFIDCEGEVKSFFNSHYVDVTKIHSFRSIKREWHFDPKDREKQISMTRVFAKQA